MRASIVIAAVAMSLSACASTGGTSSYTAELKQLSDDCRARGGILVPTPNQQDSRPSGNNFCKITGGASRLSSE